jgi:hypothetical protein
LILYDTVTTQYLVEEKHHLVTGEIVELKRLLKTSISAISKQLTSSESHQLSLAKSIRYRVGKGLSLKDAINEIITKGGE